MSFLFLLHGVSKACCIQCSLPSLKFWGGKAHCIEEHVPSFPQNVKQYQVTVPSNKTLQMPVESICKFDQCHMPYSVNFYFLRMQILDVPAARQQPLDVKFTNTEGVVSSSRTKKKVMTEYDQISWSRTLAKIPPNSVHVSVKLKSCNDPSQGNKFGLDHESTPVCTLNVC